ncbi:MAG: hypothetical protein IID41_12770, partial [Planctomycetes bacterium]|nr:hypothetical protein [Planctomycetota bacterium]
IKVERFFVGDRAFLNQSGSVDAVSRPGAALAPSVSGAAEAKFQELLDMTRETNQILGTLSKTAERKSPAQAALTPRGNPMVDS